MTALPLAAQTIQVSTGEELIRIAVAALLAGLIGLEREVSRQPAGFRTQLLLGLGAALFTIAGARVVGADPTRVGAQVVTGIGFLGAGAILRQGERVHGITTAASIWVSAAVGLACGFGELLVATVTTGVALLALVGLKEIERSFFPRVRTDVVSLDVTGPLPFGEVVARAQHVLGRVDVLRVAVPLPEVHRIELQARLGPGADLASIAERLRAIDGVRGVEIRA